MLVAVRIAFFLRTPASELMPAPNVKVAYIKCKKRQQTFSVHWRLEFSSPPPSAAQSFQL